MDADNTAYFYLASFFICYLGVLGLEALNNGWLIGYEERKRRIIKKTFIGLCCFTFSGVIIYSLIDIFL